MRETISFVSTCPLCRHPRPQHGYGRIELADSLTAEQTIDAYCLTCDVVWPISAEERSLVATLIALRAARTRVATRCSPPIERQTLMLHSANPNLSGVKASDQVPPRPSLSSGKRPHP